MSLLSHRRCSPWPLASLTRHGSNIYLSPIQLKRLKRGQSFGATFFPLPLSCLLRRSSRPLSLPPKKRKPSILRGAPFHPRARRPASLPSSRPAPPPTSGSRRTLPSSRPDPRSPSILRGAPPTSGSRRPLPSSRPAPPHPPRRTARVSSAPSRICLLGAEAPLIRSATYRIRLLGAEAPLIRSVAPLQDPPRGRLTNPRSPAPASCSAPASSRHVPHPRPSPSTPPRGATEPRRPCSEYPRPRQRDLRPNIDRAVLHRHAKLRSHGDPATLSCLQANR